MTEKNVLTEEDKQRARDLAKGLLYGSEKMYKLGEPLPLERIEEKVRVEAEDFCDGAWSRPGLVGFKEEIHSIMLKQARESYYARVELNEVTDKIVSESGLYKTIKGASFLLWLAKTLFWVAVVVGLLIWGISSLS